MPKKLPPITVPEPSLRPRPKCLYCQKTLRPRFRNHYPERLGVGAVLAMDPTERRFAGYGNCYDSFFCGLHCGYAWAVWWLQEGRWKKKR